MMYLNIFFHQFYLCLEYIKRLTAVPAILIFLVGLIIITLGNNYAFSALF